MSKHLDYYLHAYARGVDKRLIFLDDHDRVRFLLALTLSIRPQSPSMSVFIEQIDKGHLTPEDFTLLALNKRYGKPILNILSAILMPNHFHLHLQLPAPRINTHVFRRLIGSYTKYFNTRHQREGRLMSSTVKTVIIMSDPQNLHLSGYIHSNPVKSSKTNINPLHLVNYLWSTYPQYLGKPAPFTFKPGFTFDTSYFCNPQPILGEFSSPESYGNFVLSQTNTNEVLNPKELIDQSE
ncbi:MAG: hypothetical protein HYS86_02365 [Candidatus Chisholmbacteria bacterium]|nr:hypothetical protein [Candidatus Chisholmbacteria bacterium]